MTQHTHTQSITPVEALERHAMRAPAAPAYVDAQGTLSYAGLLERARRASAWLHEGGVRAGDTVVLPLDQAPASARGALEFLYAIARLGAIVLPLFPEVPLAARLELIGRFRAQWVIASDAASLPGIRALDPRGFDPARFDGREASRGDQPDAPFIYLPTSGTTGDAKILLTTQGQMHDNCRAAALSIGMDASDRQMAAIRWPSNVGLRYLLRAHAVGAAFVAAALPDTRAELCDVLGRYAVTRLSASPWQMRRLGQSPAPAAPIPPLRSVHVIGAFITPEEIEMARSTVSPNIYVGYGCTELGAVTLLRPGESVANGCVGRVLPGIEARVDDPQGRALPRGESGELGWRASWMCTGYAGNPAATRERFRDGWFYPGDIGCIDADGRVFLRGRTTELINYGGLKIWPEDIESVLKLHPDIADAALVGLPDAQAGEKPAAFLVPRAPLDGPWPASLAEKELKKFCAARIDASRVPLLFVAVARIPRNDTGKIMRGALAQAYLDAQPALTGGLARVLRAGTGR